MLFIYTAKWHINNQVPVVESIVSLTTSSRRQFVKNMQTTLSNPLLFFVEKICASFPVQMILKFFQQKTHTQWISNIYVLNFNETLTNEVVNFEQLAPDLSMKNNLFMNCLVSLVLDLLGDWKKCLDYSN